MSARRPGTSRCRPRVVEVPLPDQQVAGSGEQARGAVVVEHRNADLPVSVRALPVRGRAVRDDHRVVVVEMGIPHAERREHVLRGKSTEREAAHPLDDDRQQREAGVAVQIFRARREIERLLASDDAKDVVLGDRIVLAPPA